MKNSALVILIVLLIALGLGFCVYMIANSAEVPSVEQGTHLTVTGQGSISVVPDMATVNIGVTTTSDSVAMAQTENSATMQRVLTAIKRLGIEDKDITTAYYSINPQYNYDQAQPVIYGYQVMNTVKVTLRDIDKIGELLEKATTAGANTADSIIFGSSKADELYSMALEEAYTAAKAKGEVLADAAGMKIKGLVSVSDSSSISSPMDVRYAMADAASSIAVPVESGQLTFTATVTAVYNIK